MKSPQQELYDHVGGYSQSLGYDTYDHLPTQTENAPYPFVQVDGGTTVPVPTKTAIGAEINLTLNVWGNQEQRLDVDTMANTLLLIGARRFNTAHYRFKGIMGGSSVQMIQDTSVPDTLLHHAIVQMKFRLI